MWVLCRGLYLGVTRSLFFSLSDLSSECYCLKIYAYSLLSLSLSLLFLRFRFLYEFRKCYFVFPPDPLVDLFVTFDQGWILRPGTNESDRDGWNVEHDHKRKGWGSYCTNLTYQGLWKWWIHFMMMIVLFFFFFFFYSVSLSFFLRLFFNDSTSAWWRWTRFYFLTTTSHRYYHYSSPSPPLPCPPPIHSSKFFTSCISCFPFRLPF